MQVLDKVLDRDCNKNQDINGDAQGVAMFSFARGAISSPSIPGSLPATPRLNSTFSHCLAGPCIRIAQ